MKDFITLVSIFTGLALLTELVYVICICIINNHFKVEEKPAKKVYIRVVDTKRKDRPELDFDLGVRRVDKVRFGDEK